MTKLHQNFAFLVVAWLAFISPVWAAAIDDFNTWALGQDPAHPGMSGSVVSPSQVTLNATGAIPASTDIGYQSVSGNNVASSADGFHFSVDENFQIAVDFDISAANSIGLASIGFGVGEDSDGMNSAGAGLAIVNGVALSFAGAARINDVTQSPVLFGPAATNNGRFFIRYDSNSGDIEFGVSTSPGSAAPSHTGVFSGVQSQWSGDDLMVSFFLRSEPGELLPLPALTAGTINAEFSNFEVLTGTHVAAVPLPAGVGLFGAALVLLAGMRRMLN